MVASKFISIATVVIVIASIFSIGLVYLSAQGLFSALSGRVTSIGEANLSVETVALINFTTFSVNWGSGRVYANATFAVLDTNGGNDDDVDGFGDGSVIGGNWTSRSGLRLENQGNTNVSLNISGTKTAAQFIGGTSPVYRWRVQSYDPGSCLNSTGGTGNLPTGYSDVNITPSSQYCGRFQFRNDADDIRIDFNVTVPSDSQTGARGDTITAVAFAV